MGKIKQTIEFIREAFEKEGYTLLTEVYKNNSQKLDYICPRGHKHFITWNSWQQGQRCPYCAGNGKLTIEFIRKEFAKEGYKLLTKVYKNNSQKLDYICSRGHKYVIRWADWREGKRCPYCAGNGKPTIEFIRKEFAKEGYTLLSTEYKNNRSKLYYVCPKGHRYFIMWGNWQSGNRCWQCTNNIKHTLEFIKFEFEKEGYKLLTKTYKEAHQKLDYICPKGHKHNISWTKWQQGQRCPVCDDIKKSGKGHWNWKGGTSCEPYCDVWLDKDFKESIKQRDGYKCMNPDCWKTSKKLTIHHIDYNKKNCDPRNLITLCNSCNVRANADRKWHINWYHAITHRGYGYIYD